MPPRKAKHLRIYCICGQKMRITESMYGRPGKCVACRQKLRMPNADEIPPGTTEIYLKDHPEFLRKAARRGTAAKGAEKDAPPEEVLEPEEEFPKRPAGEAPLDVLEPLQVLCNIEFTIGQQLEVLARTQGQGGTAIEALLRRQDEVRGARAELNEEIRQRLMETAIELASTHEKIGQVNLAVRVGEMDLADFRDHVERLRRRRDALERRQVDLRGWRTVRDPYTAGGRLEAGVERIPQGPFRFALPPGPDETRGLVESHVEGLRAAMGQRATAERKLAETEKLVLDGIVSEGSVRDRRAECEAELGRAFAAIGYYRGRIEQLRSDYAADVQAADSFLNLTRGRLQVGELDRGQYDRIEQQVVRAKSDVVKGRDLLSRALSANSVPDVPRLRGTFLGRLAQAGVTVRVPIESWLAWGAALAMVVCLFLPALGKWSLVQAFREFGGETSEGYWLALVMAPVVTALLVSAAASVPKAAARGLLLVAVGLVACVSEVLFFHTAARSAGTVGGLVRNGGVWLFRPGALLFGASLVAVLAASGLALFPRKRARAALSAIVVLAAVSVGAVALEAARPGRTPGVKAGVAQVPRDAGRVPRAAPGVAPGPSVQPAARPGEPSAQTEPGNAPQTAPVEQSSQTAPESVASPAEQEKPPDVAVELRGIMAAPGRAPQFSIGVSEAPDQERQLSLSFGGIVYGDWKVSAYDPQDQTVTLSNGATILVLRRGERNPLPRGPAKP